VTAETYTLSLHDALPICRMPIPAVHRGGRDTRRCQRHGRKPATDIVFSAERLICGAGLVFVFHEQTIAFHFLRLKIAAAVEARRSEEHTSELQSLRHLVC